MPNPVKGQMVYFQTSDFSYVYWGYVVEPRHATTVENMHAFGILLDNATPEVCINYTSRNYDQQLGLPNFP